MNFSKSFSKSAFIAAVASTGAASTTAASNELHANNKKPHIIMEKVGANKMKFQFDEPSDTIGITGYELKVMGPDGFYTSSSFSGEDEIDFNTLLIRAGQPDGMYKYELIELANNQDEATISNGENGRIPGSAATGARQSIVGTGAFSVLNNNVVDPNLIEEAAPNGNQASSLRGPVDNGSRRLDIVQIDDVIVDGSLCVGVDCVNDECFEFDTIRLKENNLRIKFVDTSSSASFPSMDWKIRINDSANGGANYFAIEHSPLTPAPEPGHLFECAANGTVFENSGTRSFTIEGNAPQDSLYVSDGGRVGFGTSMPETRLHARGGDTPTLRLEQDGSGSFTPQTWDIAGNDINFFIRDVSNGIKIPFKIFSGAPRDSLTIKASGYVGIGTDTPSQKLHIVGNAPKILLEDPNAGTQCFLDCSLSTIPQNLTFVGTALSIDNGNQVDLASLVDDADADATNELQNLTFVGTALSIDNGNQVDLSALVNDADADATNELQNLTFVGTALSIDNGNQVDLSSLKTVALQASAEGTNVYYGVAATGGWGLIKSGFLKGMSIVPNELLTSGKLQVNVTVGTNSLGFMELGSSDAMKSIEFDTPLPEVSADSVVSFKLAEIDGASFKKNGASLILLLEQ